MRASCGPCGRDQPLALSLTQLQRGSQAPNGVWVRMAPLTPFQGADRVLAQASPLRKRFLRTPGRLAMAPQEVPKPLGLLSHDAP